MMPRRLIDTNLIIRYLTQDHERHAAAAEKLFAQADARKLGLEILPEVLAESVFVLESFYKLPRKKIADALGMLIRSEAIRMDGRDIHVDALARYGATRLHFVDCVLAATAARLKLPVATFDAEFKKIGDVTVAVE